MIIPIFSLNGTLISSGNNVHENSFSEHGGTCVVLPHVLKTLELLYREGRLMGLLTGNVEGTAWKKCETAGIKRFFKFGAFGNEGFRRADLVPLAIRRAKERSFSAEKFVIVGDTPQDIACARENGIKSIGVATGRYSPECLHILGADVTIKSLDGLLNALSFIDNTYSLSLQEF